MEFTAAVRRNITTAAYAQFSGRASRSEYWWFQLFSVLAPVAAGAISLGLGTAVQVVLIVPGLATSVRRLHDVGRSGWWLLVGLTGIGLLLLLYWFVKASDPRPNAHGAGPATA